ncbi:uncharacterized protein [Antedon mediterranea]|uniref:uncharacterized protein n=1 Tax=Antedon mediterranea TaxID=105859 RepID=UPI003AF80506
MWKPYAEEYGVSMYELTGYPASKGRMMYMKQQAGYEIPHNELQYAPESQKFKQYEPKPVRHTSQSKDYYVNPQHMAEEDRPKRRTVSPSRPKIQSKELITGKRGSRAAEMFVRAREHTDQHVVDDDKVFKKKQVRNYSPWEETFREVTISADKTYEEPATRKFQNVTSPRIPRKVQQRSQERSIEQVDYSYTNGFRPRSTKSWKGDSERLKRFHREVEPFKMNYNRAPTGWANSSECSEDAFDLGILDTQLPKSEFRISTKKARQEKLSDFNARPKSWVQDYYEEEEEEEIIPSTAVRSRRVQFEQHSTSPRISRHNQSALKIRPVKGPKMWLPQSEDL